MNKFQCYKKYVKEYIYAFLLIGLLMGCVDEQYDKSDVETPLKIKVLADDVNVRALIENGIIPNGEAHAIGLHLIEGNGVSYDGIKYQNIKATPKLAETGQEWDMAQNMMLSSTKGTLYAYYPYNPDVTDITSIPVQAGETDYMYATPVHDLNDKNNEAVIVMKHALACIRIKLQKGSYSGTDKVTALRLQSENIAGTGTIDAIHGTLQPDNNAHNVLLSASSLQMNLNSEGTEVDFIVIPVEGSEKAPVFTVTLGEKDYTVTADAIKYEQGTVYEYTLSFNENGLALSGVSYDHWGYDANDTPIIKAEHNITIKGNIEGIAFNNTVNEDGSVTIIAVPLDKGKEVEEVYVDGATTIEQTVNNKTGVRTIKLSNITADEQVNFQGAWFPVKILGNITGMTFTRRRAEDGSLTVTAIPVDDEDMIQEATGTGDAVMTEYFDETKGSRAFTITSMNSSYTLKMNGVISSWLVAT